MATSMETTKAEITRFLGGSEPSVLCVTGEWGVGKTYLWRTVLDKPTLVGQVAMSALKRPNRFGARRKLRIFYDTCSQHVAHSLVPSAVNIHTAVAHFFEFCADCTIDVFRL